MGMFDFLKSKTIEELLLDLKDKNEKVRIQAVKSLSKENRDTKIVDTLIEALDDKNESVRRITVKALGRIDDARAVKPLIYVLKNKNENSSIRAEAICSLAAIRVGHDFGSKDHLAAMDALIDALKDESAEIGNITTIQWLATEALMRFKDLRAVEPLITLMKKVYEKNHFGQVLVGTKDKCLLMDFGGTIACSLREITGQKIYRDVAKWQEWWQKNKEKS